MEKVTSPDGTPIAYYRAGSGPPLVLVHGISLTHASWARVLPALEEHFSVYAVERRGRGESGDGATYAVEREIEDIAAVLEAARAPAYLLGHSYGGHLAMEAALGSRKVRKLILYEGIPLPGIPPEGSIEPLEALLDAGKREKVLMTFYREHLRMPPQQIEWYRSQPEWPVQVAAADTLPRELRAYQEYKFDALRCRDLQTRTLLLLGGASPPFVKSANEAAHKVLPDCEIAVIPGQGHFAYDTAPDLFVRHVVTFLHGPG